MAQLSSLMVSHLQKNWILAWFLLLYGVPLVLTITPRKPRNNALGWPVPVHYKPQLLAVLMDYGLLSLCL